MYKYTYQYLPVIFFLNSLFSYFIMFSFYNLKIDTILIKYYYRMFFPLKYVLVYSTQFFQYIPIYKLIFIIINRYLEQNHFFAHNYCMLNNKYTAMLYTYYTFLTYTSTFLFDIIFTTRLIVILTKLLSFHYPCKFSHAKIDLSFHSFRVFLSDNTPFLFFQYRLFKRTGKIISTVLLDYILIFHNRTKLYANLDLLLYFTQFFPFTITLSFHCEIIQHLFPLSYFSNYSLHVYSKSIIIHND